MRPGRHNGNGMYRNTREHYTLDLCVVDRLTETWDDKKCTFLNLQRHHTD